MKCPVCKETDLVMADRQNIEIDYCPQCRGVWLDRGELDKIIERSTTTGFASSAARDPMPDSSHQPRYSEQQRGSDDDYHRRHKKKRHGFLGELFDFD
jgi:uncharacterized protein